MRAFSAGVGFAVMVIRKVLIANRGEIAVRVMRTAKARGVATVAVYSDADKNALHVRMADKAVCIGGPAPADSYLNIAAIIEAAKATGADAIHPGYGFLSERADFADACEKAGIVFIGPPASAMAAMGDKAEARRRMTAAGVACIPGYDGEEQSDARLAKEAKAIGFPVMVKAASGGGGRGMRVVDKAAELKDALASARKEAESAFGDGRLLIEKLVVGASHVEIQVIADIHGNIIHLGERDCSLQRRRQKVIEEAPSPAISPEIREAMGAAAVEAARAAGYQNAGTVEFLFDPKTKEFFFLEMNARLQVEHPVTELVTGVDLVDLQFDVAEGKELPLAQKDVALKGHAIEARLYAEDPAYDFMPYSGRIRVLEFPSLKHVRVDAGVDEGDMVTTFYDPIIAKVIAHGATRDEARAKLAAALRQMRLLGVAHNRNFLISLLEEESFAKGETDIDYIESNLERLARRSAPGGAAALALVGAALVDWPFNDTLTGWRSSGEAGFPLLLVNTGEEIIRAEIKLDGASITARRDDAEATIEVLSKTTDCIQYRQDGHTGEARYARNVYHLELEDSDAWERYTDYTLVPASEGAAGGDAVKAPMAGLVTGVRVIPGDPVSKGTTVATIEAMKMEHQLTAPRDGVIETVSVQVGDQVAIRTTLVVLKALEC